MDGEANIGRVKVNNLDMRRSRKFGQRGPTLTTVFIPSLDEGKEDQNTT